MLGERGQFVSAGLYVVASVIAALGALTLTLMAVAAGLLPRLERRRQAADRLARLERLDASARDADTDDDGGEQSHHGERPEGVDEERPGE